MSDSHDPTTDSLHDRDAATNRVTGVFLVALALCVLAGIAFAEQDVDRVLNALAGGALLSCGALFLWRARAHRRRGDRA